MLWSAHIQISGSLRPSRKHFVVGDAKKLELPAGRVGLHGPPEAWEQLSPPTSCLSSSSRQPPPAALSSVSPAVSLLHGTALSPLVTVNVCPVRAPGVAAHKVVRLQAHRRIQERRKEARLRLVVIRPPAHQKLLLTILRRRILVLSRPIRWRRRCCSFISARRMGCPSRRTTMCFQFFRRS